ncbi:hypothetical protein [Serinibacter arcticus]|uniref:Uncharacterized protein n=1 Tax=Serinibacter arcticus TaxID=1655435 RepID=A0A4Z1DZL9_9MICO|nr:hypothetical protein [Serinibacter arcticus]TGO04480.1 hypothetical protein SERN_2073 [Serinibacter arcticus]
MSNHDHLPSAGTAPDHPDRAARGRRYLRAGLALVATSAALALLSQIVLRPSTVVHVIVVTTLFQYAAVPVPVAAGLIGAGLVLREVGSRQDGDERPDLG